MMAKRIQHYRRKVHREANDGTTTRHIAVEEHSDGVYLIVYEVGRTKDKYGSIIGYDLRPVLSKRYLKLEEGISAAETVFDSNMNLGFREVIADTSAGG
jgi:hypothetical protein